MSVVEACPKQGRRGLSTNGTLPIASTPPPFALSSSKEERHFLLFLFVLLFFFTQFSLAFAQVGGIPHFKPPPLVRIIGAFASLEDTQRSNLQTLTVQVKKDKWRLRIREIKALTATTNSGWGLLKDLFPPWLCFVGPDDLITRLQRSDIVGQILVLEGRLYTGDHMLYLTAVTVTEP